MPFQSLCDGFIDNKNVRATEFASAISTFASNPSLKKLSRKDSNLQNSYIKLDDGTVLALSSKNISGKVLGKGALGRCKYVMDKDDNTYVIKIETANSAAQENETVVLTDLKYLLHKTKTEIVREHTKFYTTMFNLGKSLERYISMPCIDSEYKFSIARKIAWEVHKLHAGQLSNTGTQYAHLDIKPANIVVDKKNNIWLIDFGTAVNINEPNFKPITTTSMYQPSSFDDNQLEPDQYLALVGPRLQELGPAGIDQYALKRTLFLPIYNNNEKIDPSTYGFCLFSKDEFDQLPERIKALLNTEQVTDVNSNISTPLEIATLFLLMECKLSPDLINILSHTQKLDLCELAYRDNLPISEDDPQDDLTNMTAQINDYLSQNNISETRPRL